jgi:hypothetical protein
MGRARWMNDRRNIKFRLEEAEMYLQFLKEDLDLIESLDESIVSQINQLLKEARRLLRESANLFNIEIEKDSVPTP